MNESYHGDGLVGLSKKIQNGGNVRMVGHLHWRECYQVTMIIISQAHYIVLKTIAYTFHGVPDNSLVFLVCLNFR